MFQMKTNLMRMNNNLIEGCLYKASFFFIKESFMKRKYTYNGPVFEFDTCIERNWSAKTIAKSANEAKRNFAYQYKKQHGRTVNAKISLPGSIV